MILKPPVNRGITAQGRDVIPVNNFADLNRCISQYFGENKLDWYKKTFGMLGHNGLDIWALRGEKIVASHDGIITEISKDESAGIGVVIWDGLNLYKTIYWHLKTGSVRVELGQDVKTGNVLGLCNNTGWSTGDHLHFGLKKTNEQGTTINRDNGFYGAIDPLSFFEETMDKELLDLIYQFGFKRDADSGANAYLGMDTKEVLRLLLSSKENMVYSEVFKKVKAVENWARTS